MSLVNGESADKWINRHKPENGWFRVYYIDSSGHQSATMTPGKQLRWEWKYKNGKRADGVSKGWYLKGQLKQIQHYKNGVRHGKTIRYFPNGQIMDKFDCKDGLRHGLLKSYLENGVMAQESVWESGECIKHNVNLIDEKKVSYILTWTDTSTLEHTLELIQQILEMNPLEILIVDSKGNFPKQDNPLIKIIPSNQTYNRGIKEAKGDYFVLQNTNTKYIFDGFSREGNITNPAIILIAEALELLLSKSYEYITIDKKLENCYWFLCRKDFYLKNNIKKDEELKYLHLPGFFESNLGYVYTFPLIVKERVVNTPFLIHRKKDDIIV